ncbi:bardet-Biedl syndrome 1 family protein [Pavlovales sp. CCMP2436]|nr:bardet-Biedl syndrome 1 family protein [Pavlovales sp. CCMP2436]
MAAAAAKSPWLHAWRDPVADLKAFSPCMRLVDLNGDGDYKLIVADAERRLKVYRNTSLISENVLLDVPVSMCVTYTEASKPRVPCVSVASGPHVFIYRRLRPYYKFTVPPTPMAQAESDTWTKLNRGDMEIGQAVDALINARDSGAALTTRSVDLINTDSADERRALVDAWRSSPLTHQTVITCMETIKKNMDDDDALSQLVIGTESGSVLILDVGGVTIVSRFQLPSAPVYIAVTGLCDVEYRIVCACRNGSVYTIKNGELTGTAIELEAQPCGLVRVDKLIMVACMGSVVHAYHIKGKKSYSLYQPAPVAAIEVLTLQRVRSAKALLVSLHNGEVRLYSEKTVVATLHVDDPAVGMRFGAYGREEAALALVGKAGTLVIKMLQRTANLDASSAPPGPPSEQDIPLAIPKKTKLYVEQTQREREQATEMHRIFQRDLCKLRLNTARAYVKVLTDGQQGPQSYTVGTSVRLTAQVQGLGPLFKLKLNLQNMGSKPIHELEMSLSGNPMLYRLRTRVLKLPLLLPSLTYRCECDVESIDESGASDAIRVYVCNTTSKLPIISAVVNMPLSEAPVPE